MLVNIFWCATLILGMTFYLLHHFIRNVPTLLPCDGRAVVCNGKALLRGIVKHKRVLQLDLLAPALLSINFVLKLDVLFIV